MEKPRTLTAAAVTAVFLDCLYQDDEIGASRTPPDGAICVEGIMHKVAFHPDRITQHRSKIRGFLLELPDCFHRGTGGGWSFLNACMDRHGHQWGEQLTADQLFSLGMAIGAVVVPFGREMWSMLPGGMPYYCVDVGVVP